MSSDDLPSPALYASTSSSSSTSSTKRNVLVLDEESRILYTRCNLCTSDWKTKDVIVRHGDGTAYHAGCYMVEYGRKTMMSLPGMSSLTSEQRRSFLKKAAAQSESIPKEPVTLDASTAAVQQVTNEDCRPCSRIKADDFFQCSDTASSIMTQVNHFKILLEDETVLAAFSGASKNFKMSIIKKIVKLLLHIASASSQGAMWTHRSIATSTALVCKRLEAEFSLDFQAAKEDDTLKEVEFFLGEEGTRQSMRSIVTGLLVKDAMLN